MDFKLSLYNQVKILGVWIVSKSHGRKHTIKNVMNDSDYNITLLHGFNKTGAFGYGICVIFVLQWLHTPSKKSSLWVAEVSFSF